MPIAKRTKSKNRMRISEFLARLSQHKRVLREIQGIWANSSFHKCFRNTGFCPLRNLQNRPPFQFVCLSLVWVMTSLARFAILKQNIISRCGPFEIKQPKRYQNRFFSPLKYTTSTPVLIVWDFPFYYRNSLSINLSVEVIKICSVNNFHLKILAV